MNLSVLSALSAAGLPKLFAQNADTKRTHLFAAHAQQNMNAARKCFFPLSILPEWGYADMKVRECRPFASTLGLKYRNLSRLQGIFWYNLNSEWNLDKALGRFLARVFCRYKFSP